MSSQKETFCFLAESFTIWIGWNLIQAISNLSTPDEIQNMNRCKTSEYHRLIADISLHSAVLIIPSAFCWALALKLLCVQMKFVFQTVWGFLKITFKSMLQLFCSFLVHWLPLLFSERKQETDQTQPVKDVSQRFHHFLEACFWGSQEKTFLGIQLKRKLFQWI